MEPELLRRGKEFHKLVQADFEGDVEGARVYSEHTITLASLRKAKTGRLDLLIEQLQDFVTVLEIKSTNWDKVKPKNVTRLMGAHRRQVWKYVGIYLDVVQVNVVATVIYPRAPVGLGLAQRIEEYHNGYFIQVMWFYE